MKGTRTLIGLICLFWLGGCSAMNLHRTTTAPTTFRESGSEEAIIGVQVSSQSYSFFRPWDKKTAGNRTGLGVVMDNGLILVSARLVAESTYIELEKNNGGPRSPARIRLVDYKANLALLEPVDHTFLQAVRPMTVHDHLVPDEPVEVLFGKKDGRHEQLSGRVRDVEVARYPFGAYLLVAGVKIDLAKSTDASSLPVIQEGRLLGIGMGYSHTSKTLKTIPLQVIRHFLTDFADGDYQGFPVLGVDVSSLDDSQLRDYLHLQGREDGVYLYRVRAGGAARRAGIRAGDVLLSIDDLRINRFGSLEDPELGLIHFSHYISCRRFSGDRVVLTIFRDGREQRLEVRLATARFQDAPIPSYLEGRPPKYMILGGLVLTELSRQYLQEWGGQWLIKAPEKLVHFYLNQWDLLKPGERVVLLSHVLPTRAMIGYTELDNMVVRQVNGQPIHRLEDVATALKTPIGRFHQLSFIKDERAIYLDRFTLEKENRFIKKRYGISRLQRLGNEKNR